MNPQSDHRHYVRRVVLPSGKTIEVVYFEDARMDQPAAPQRQTDLHVCPECSSILVYPVEWAEAGSTRWEVQLRCPNCEWSETGVFDQAVVERLDEELDNGAQVLMRDLKQLAHANMEEEIERFVDALSADHILPMDF